MTEPTRPPHRLAYIDNLRWSAISMVVVMHAAVTYSPFGSWYYRERPPLSLGAKLAFATYQSLQHAVSMGLLFGIAGFFAAGAVSRKGVGAFLRERLRRLGLPLLAYIALIGPFTEYYVAANWRPLLQGGFAAAWLQHLRTGALLGGSGPLWFCLVLLAFSAVFATLCRLRPIRPSPRDAPATTTVLLYAALMAAATFAVGAVWPAARTVLNVNVHDFPQYPFMFAAGVAAWRGDWLARVDTRIGRRWLVGGLAVSVALWTALVVTGGALEGQIAAYGGGWHWQAAGMDIWRSFTCIALSLGLMTLYRDRFGAQGPLARFLTRNAFGVYVFHAPVLVAITRAMRAWPAPPGLKFALASLLGIAVTFLLVGLLASLARRAAQARPATPVRP